ncbi:unnamed protein product [Adineta ricciae]|uniref:DYW domain-containing protein n=1 Tax=Adineta ricciae TaxID=249248 RepID=A0A814HKU9_ADIRI|nr:unnamed protein product [Adineta ricciae]
MLKILFNNRYLKPIYLIRSYHNLKLFRECEQTKHDMITDLAVGQALKSCANIKDFQAGSRIHHRYASLIEKNNYSMGSLIDFYMQSKDVDNAQLLFDKLKKKTVAIYSIMMKGYIRNNQAQKAIEIFFQIPNTDEKSVSLFFHACSQVPNEKTLELVKKVFSNLPDRYQNNEYILTNVFNVFIKCNDLSNAEKIFPKIATNALSYGNFMNALNKNNQPVKTLSLFEEMTRKCIKLDATVSLFLLNACAAIGIYTVSQSIFEEIPKSCLNDVYIKNALIDMWGKSGCIGKAKNTFESLSQPETVGYTSMINSYGLNGMGFDAVKLFYQMPVNLIRDETYVCVLNACSHAGLVEEAQKIFATVEKKTEEICTIMVDCFSRLSLFTEAKEIIDTYESNHAPSPGMLMALLSGARNAKNLDLAEKTFHRIQKHFPQLKHRIVAASVLLANADASIVNGKIYVFRAHDSSHPQSKEINQELTSHGHDYDSSWITRSLNSDETIESVLCGHSERLTIAWNFVVHPNASRIQITKNLRVCGDCHRATKLIASIRQCEIIVRDANRIHHFYRNGQCSCNDHF